MKNNLAIIKIGTSVLIDENGQLRESVIRSIFSAVSEKIKKGEKIALVSSGAVAMGRAVSGDKEMNKRLAASIGQVHLMSYFLGVAREMGLETAQLLISRAHLIQRQQFLQLQQTIEQALPAGVIPIINENDALVIDWGFSDNDSLAVSLAIASNASRLIVLSHVPGLYTGDPSKDQNVELIKEVKDVNAELMKYCGKEASEQGRGGMLSKLKAARLCTAVGIPLQIVDGLNTENIGKALDNESVGTVFLPRQLTESMKNRDRWLLAAKSSPASIEVDDGAVSALKNGKSLLAVGIKKIYGSFAEKEIVEIVNDKKEGIAFGLTDVSSKMLEQKEFSMQKGIQVMHADNIMVFA